MKAPTTFIAIAALLMVCLAASVICPDGSDAEPVDPNDEIRDHILEMLEKDLKVDGYTKERGELSVEELKDKNDKGLGIYKVTIKSKNSLFDTINIGNSTTFVSSYRQYFAELVIDGEFKTIGKYTFAGYSTLRTLTFTNGLSDGIEIGDMAFKNCTALMGMSGTLNGVGLESFANCPNLGLESCSITVNKNIGKEAFSGCKYLEKIHVTKPIDSIGDTAFQGCTSFKGFYGSSLDTVDVGSIGAQAFAGCVSLQEISLKTRDGMVIGIEAFKGSGVTSVRLDGSEHHKVVIMEGAFSDCTHMETFDNATGHGRCDLDIGKGAFSGCVALKEIQIRFNADNVIPQNAFAGCRSLERVVITSLGHQITIENSAFRGCESLQLITEYYLGDLGVKYIIKDNAFTGCDSLYQIRAGRNGSATISAHSVSGLPAFDSFIGPNSELLEVKIDGSGEYAFSGCTYFRAIKLGGDTIYPHMFEGTGLRAAPVMSAETVRIGEKAFANCSSLAEFKMDGKCILDGQFIFLNCTSLASAELSPVPVAGEVVTLPQGTFSGCSLLQDLKLSCGGMVLDVESGSFGSCSGLETLTVTDVSEVVFGSDVFSGSGKLRTVDVPQGASVTVSAYSFRGQTGLEKIGHDRDDAVICGDAAAHAFEGCTKLASVCLGSRDGSVIDIADSMFEGSGVSQLVIGGQAVFGARSFANCDKLVYLGGIYAKAIKENAFSGCIRLVKVTGYLVDTTEAVNAFSGCIGLEEFSMDLEETSDFCVAQGMFSGCSQLREFTVRDLRSEDGKVTVNAGAFLNCALLKKIDLPISHSTYYLDGEAFSGCTSLEVVHAHTADDSHSVVITNRTFRGLPNLVGILEMSGEASIIRIEGDGTYAFSGCTSLSQVRIAGNIAYEHMFEGSGLTLAPVFDSPKVEIRENAFSGCSKMKEFKPVYDVVLEGSDIFSGCPSMVEISLKLLCRSGERVVTLPSGIFSGMPGLRNVVLDTKGVSNIELGTETFASCPNLEHLSLPGSPVMTFYPYVFSSEGKLKDVVVNAGSQVVVMNNAFRNQSSLSRISCNDPADSDASVLGNGASYAFAGCIGLKSVLIKNNDPKGTCLVAQSMFEGSGLVSIKLDSDCEIQDRAFADCVSLRNVSTGRMCSVGNSSFEGCRSIQTLEMHLMPADSNRNCFAGCSSLIRIDLETTGGYTFGAGFFEGCPSLRDVNIDVKSPGDVVFGQDAFRNCSMLGSLVIEGPVFDVVFGDNAMAGCTNLGIITVPVRDSVPCEVTITNTSMRNLPNLRSIADKDGNLSYIRIRADSSYAFAGCSSLVDVRLVSGIIAEHMFDGSGIVSAPEVKDAVMVVSDRAFAGCDKMAGFLPAVPVHFTGTYAFYGCTALESVGIRTVSDTPGAVYALPEGTFAGCSTLASFWIDTGLEQYRLESGLFASCSKLETVTISNSDTVSVGSNVFASSGSLRDFTVDGGVSVVVEHDSFRNQSSLTGIHCTSTSPNDAQIIGDDARFAFAGCTSLSTVLLYFEDPSAVNDIAEGMFEGSGLTELRIFGPVSVGNRAFAECQRLASINGGFEAVHLGSGAFSGCSALSGIDFVVGDMADSINVFAGCTLLRDVSLKAVSSERVVLPYGFFSGCGNLRTLVLDGDFHLEKNLFNGCDALEIIQVSACGVHITAEAFRGAPYLVNILVIGTSDPATVTIVGNTDYAFYGCSKLRMLNLSVEGETGRIGAYMFYNCSELARIQFDKAKTWDGFGDYAFAGCSFLKGIGLTDGSPVAFKGDVKVSMSTFNGCNSLEEISLESKGGKVVFGNGSVTGNNGLCRITVSGAEEVVFEEHALGNCPSLTEVRAVSDQKGSRMTLGESALAGLVNLQVLDAGGMLLSVGPRALENLTHLKEIRCAGAVAVGDYGLYNCSLLREFSLDPSIEVLGDHAFAGCTELVLMPISKTALRTLGSYAFENCTKIVSLDFSDSRIERIGEGAFSSCSRLESLDLPSTIRAIEDRTFEGCSMLSHVNFADMASLESVGDYAFRNSAIATAEFPAALKTIGKGAFTGCEKMVTVVFGSYVETIGESAFAGCSSIGALDLPRSVTSVGDSAFRGCSSLLTVDLRELPALDTVPLRIFSDCTRLETVLLPNGVSGIGDWAFFRCEHLTFLDFSDANHVASIGEGAFSGCRMITVLDFPEVRHIGQQAFDGCSSLYSLSLSPALEEGSVFGNYMFNGCENLLALSIPANVVAVGDHAFSGCYKISAVTIPASVKSLGAGAFEKCYSLAEVGGAGCEITSLGADAFNGCYGLETLNMRFVCTLPEMAFEGCTSLRSLDLSGCSGAVPDGLAYGCISLESVLLPEGCGSIGEHAFDGCAELVLPVTNNLGSELYVGAYAFNDCASLTAFPGCTIVSLGEYAFNGCSGLELGNVTVVSEEIPDYAFAGCAALAGIPSGAKTYGAHSFEGAAAGSPAQDVVLGAVETVGDYAFSGIRSVTFTIGGSIRAVGEHAFENTGFTGKLDSDNLSMVGAYAFAGCSATDVYIRSANAEGFALGEFSFSGCPELKTVKISVSNLVGFSTSAFDNCPKLESIDLGGSFTEYNGALYTPDMKVLFKVVKHVEGRYSLHPDTVAIEGYAFKGCDAVTAVDNTAALATIGEHAFEGCSSLAEFDLSNVTAVGAYAFASTGLHDVKWSAGSTIPEGVFRDCAKLAVFESPTKIRSVGKYAFENCGGLTGLGIMGEAAILDDGCFRGCSGFTGALNVPSSIAVLGKGVFENCTGIEKVSYSRTAAVPDDCFRGCTSLVSVGLISGVQGIGSGSFRGCTSLCEILLPGSIVTLGDGAFAGCTSLDRIDLPERITSVPAEMFLGCTALEYISVPQKVLELGDSAFRGCTSLVYIDLHSGLRTIGGQAFSGCTALVDPELPNSISSVGAGAFAGCTSIRMFDLPDLTVTVEEGTFRGCTSLATVVIHQGLAGIGDRAFSGAVSLVELSGVNGIRSVGSLAFEDCANLRSFTITRQTESIAYDAFAGCVSLSAIEVDPDNRNFAFDGNSVYEYRDDVPYALLKVLPLSGSENVTVPATVRIVSPAAVFGLPSLKEIGFLGNIEAIGDRNFELCPMLGSIVLTSDHYRQAGPALVSSDGERILAITGTGKLEVQASVRVIDAAAFLNMGRCSEVVIDPSNAVYALKDGSVLSRDGSVLYKVLDAGAELVVPAGVGTVGAYAITGGGIHSLTVPGAVVFSCGAIYQCGSLSKLVISDKGAVFEEGSISAGTGSTPVTIHVTAPAGYTVPSEALGPYTKLDYGPVDPGKEDSGIGLVIPAVAVIAVIAVIGAGVFVIRRQ